MARVAVLGGGAWGTALAVTACRAGHDVLLWARDSQTVDTINRQHENPNYLPGIRLEEGLRASSELEESLDGAALVLMAVPAQVMRHTLARARSTIARSAVIVLCAKGLEKETGALQSQIAREMLPNNALAALSGPSFAIDVARGKPTAVTVASARLDTAIAVARWMSTSHFRCYSSEDLAGVEIAGALKNVLALAVGAAAGANLGASAQAALVTRGFVELRRMAHTFGARPETLMGLSGLGDLVLTCGSLQSRNFSYGMAMGRSESLTDRPLAEGVATSVVAAKIARQRGIEAPIIAAVDKIIKGDSTVDDQISALLSRPLKSEIE